MTYRLYLVRHAMPTLVPDVPPADWELGDEGRRGAQSLGDVLPPHVRLIASNEPKAQQTLQPLGHVLPDARFREVERDEPYDGDFRARHRAFVNGADHPGWEPRTKVLDRFGHAAWYWWNQSWSDPVAIASHGMAMTVWLASVLPIADPAGFWADLRLPDVLAVDLELRTVRRVLSTQLFQVHSG
jgi:broad specificity phosphatase PhoE